jgi:hypothetical protein
MIAPILLLWRAALLECPICGRQGLFRDWLALRDACHYCGLSLERGEGYRWTLTKRGRGALSARPVLLALPRGGT